MTGSTASLSMDLDNKWAYLRAAGRSDWNERPGYLPMVIERIVAMLGELGLPLTVFTVGRDLCAGCRLQRDYLVRPAQGLGTGESFAQPFAMDAYDAGE